MADKEAPKPVIAAAAGTASTRGGLTGAMIEQVMAQAGLDAMAEGILDPNEIRDRKLAARQKLKDEMRASQEKIKDELRPDAAAKQG